MVALKVFVSDDYERLGPVPGSAVVVAENEEQARQLLTQTLREHLMKDTDFTLREIALTLPHVATFESGEY